MTTKLDVICKMSQFCFPITPEDTLIFLKRGSKIVVNIVHNQKEFKVGTILRENWPIGTNIKGYCLIPGYYNCIIRLSYCSDFIQKKN